MSLEWIIEEKPIEYEKAMHQMALIAEKVAIEEMPEKIWVLEHNDIYTLGTSTKEGDIINKNVPKYVTNRGGQVTYHGPGQRIIYPIINIKKRMPVVDIRKYVKSVENWIIRVLANFGIQGEIKEGRVGVWVATPGRYFPHFEAKIAAIGIRVSKGVAYHGFAVNIATDLEKYKNIIPCGLPDYGVTSLLDLGIDINYQEFDEILYQEHIKFLEDISC